MASYLSQIQVGENTYHINPVIATENTSGTAAVTTSPYTASIWRINLPEITELYTGLTILYKVPVAGNGTYGTLLRINGTNASSDSSSNLYPVCANVTTMIGTRYAVGCIVALTFDASQVGLKLYYNSDSASTTVEGGTGWTKPGCWKISDYNTNDNTIGYQLRGNQHTLPLQAKTYRYRLLFTSKNGTKFVPATTSSSTNATSSRTVNLEPIDPFGEIVYYGSTSAVAANASPAAASLWSLYTLTLGYSFNRTGAALVLDYPKALYIKCTPQSDGSAIIDSTTPYVLELPSSADGKIYIFLGVAYAETTIELLNNHPVYYYSDAGGIKLWSGAVLTSTLPNSSSTDLQFPTSKAVYDYVQSLPEPSGTVTSVGVDTNTDLSTKNIPNGSDGDPITTSGTIYHKNSGATAGNYGDSSAQTPAFGDAFSVPYISVNARGHVTGISAHNVTLPTVGSALTNLNASNLSSGTVSTSVLPTIPVGKLPTLYWANQTVSSASSTTTTPVVSTITVQNDSNNKCKMLYDSTEECMKFVFS